MRNKYILPIIIALTLSITNSLSALNMSHHAISKFKKEVVEFSRDILNLPGEYKNNSYYVNLNAGEVKSFRFQNAIVTFDGLSKSLLESFKNDGFNFEDLKDIVKIKFATILSQEELQAYINNEILHSSAAHKIFSEANFSYENNYFVIEGKINMKRIPGNPFALFSSDDFVPFIAKVKPTLSDNQINLDIIDGNVNGQEITGELKQMFVTWLNPIWDFSKLDFNASIQTLEVINSGLKLAGTIF